MNNNTKDKILQDKNKITNKKTNWRSHKMDTQQLAESYKRLRNNKFYYVENCGTFLEFKRFDDGYLKLHRANFCKVRLCPMCSWRRSLKIFHQVSKIMNEIDLQKNKFIFLTLTCKNVESEKLTETLDELLKAFNLLSKRKRFKKSVLGWFRCLEVTYNSDEDTFHPHIHCVLTVPAYYFKLSEYYISQDDWTKLWQSCLNIKYTPIVDVRKFRKSKRGIGKEVAEVSKYAVKTTDYLKQDDETTDYLVSVFDKALTSRRLVAFGGIFKMLHKQFNLDDVENGDLINTSENLREDLGYMIVKYRWKIGTAGLNYYEEK